jgi:hypothetical protein
MMLFDVAVVEQIKVFAYMKIVYFVELCVIAKLSFLCTVCNFFLWKGFEEQTSYVIFSVSGDISVYWTW